MLLKDLFYEYYIQKISTNNGNNALQVFGRNVDFIENGKTGGGAGFLNLP